MKTFQCTHFQVIKIYNSKLDDREKRKRFVIDRGLIDRKEQQLVSWSNSWTKEFGESLINLFFYYVLLIDFFTNFFFIYIFSISFWHNIVFFIFYSAFIVIQFIVILFYFNFHNLIYQFINLFCNVAYYYLTLCDWLIYFPILLCLYFCFFFAT